MGGLVQTHQLVAPLSPRRLVVRFHRNAEHGRGHEPVAQDTADDPLMRRRARLRFAMTKCGRGVDATMIGGNAPALALYRSLGFKLMSSHKVTVPGFFAPKASWRLQCHDLRYALAPGEDR